MSNGQSPINLTRIATRSLAGGHAPLPGMGEAAKTDVAKYKPVTEHTVVKRTIPVTDYKPHEDDAEPEAVAKPADAAAEKDRHTKWREAQEAKRTEKMAADLDAATKRQGLAKELLAKRDLGGAAKALGIQVSELVTYVNEGAMGMKPEPEVVKPPTPEEAFKAEQAAFRKEMSDFKAEQIASNNSRNMAGFIEANFRPLLADKDAYEMIHASGSADVEAYAYRYMNEHYFETSEKDEAGKIVKPGEVLNAKDVLDKIEESLTANAEAAVTRQKGVKKLAKHFVPSGEVAQTLGAGTGEASSTALTGSRRAQIDAAMSALLLEAGPGETEEEEPEPEAAIAAKPAKADPVKPVRTGGPVTNIRGTHVLAGRGTVSDRVARARQG
jgi:hypothetical protein